MHSSTSIAVCHAKNGLIPLAVYIWTISIRRKHEIQMLRAIFSLDLSLGFTLVDFGRVGVVGFVFAI